MSEKDSNEAQTGEMPETEPQATQKPAKAAMDPVRKFTLIILAMALLLLAWYLVSDRMTPLLHRPVCMHW